MTRITFATSFMTIDAFSMDRKTLPKMTTNNQQQNAIRGHQTELYQQTHLLLDCIEHLTSCSGRRRFNHTSSLTVICRHLSNSPATSSSTCPVLFCLSQPSSWSALPVPLPLFHSLITQQSHMFPPPCT